MMLNQQERAEKALELCARRKAKSVGLVAIKSRQGIGSVGNCGVTDSKHGLPVADNLLDRNFTPVAPNQVWTSDITYLWTDEGCRHEGDQL